jgi:hypothetical protein
MVKRRVRTSLIRLRCLNRSGGVLQLSAGQGCHPKSIQLRRTMSMVMRMKENNNFLSLAKV